MAVPVGAEHRKPPPQPHQFTGELRQRLPLGADAFPVDPAKVVVLAVGVVVAPLAAARFIAGLEASRTTVRDYYEALRRGEPLYPYFSEQPTTWKAAISTDYEGYDAVAEALREQTRTTEEWTVESKDLSVTEWDGHALFHDAVRMAWTNAETGQRRGFDSRWSGALDSVDEADQEWQFGSSRWSACRGRSSRSRPTHRSKSSLPRWRADSSRECCSGGTSSGCSIRNDSVRLGSGTGTHSPAVLLCA